MIVKREDFMKLFEIEFNGYKRFQEAKCNVDGPLVAFVGPNESGKSSLLGGLAWLTNEGSHSLTARDQNRRNQPNDEDLVVRARYRIDADDVAAITDLGLDTDALPSLESVSQFRLSRKRDGQQVTGVDTSLVRSGRCGARSRR